MAEPLPQLLYGKWFGDASHFRKVPPYPASGYLRPNSTIASRTCSIKICLLAESFVHSLGSMLSPRCNPFATAHVITVSSVNLDLPRISLSSVNLYLILFHSRSYGDPTTSPQIAPNMAVFNSSLSLQPSSHVANHFPEMRSRIITFPFPMLLSYTMVPSIALRSICLSAIMTLVPNEYPEGDPSKLK